MKIYVENIAEDRKGKITVYYDEENKEFQLVSNSEYSVLSNEKIHDFYESIVNENKNNKSYKIQIANKMKAPKNSVWLFSLDDYDRRELKININGFENLDVSNVTDMSFMFSSALNCNLNVSGWDTSNVEGMASMFEDAYNANPDVSKWNVSNVKNMSYMFSGAKEANPDVSNWNVSKFTKIEKMFGGLDREKIDLSNWNIDEDKIDDLF